ncbi:MAG: DegV family protein [Acholeplasma sp.]|nr:DegV family protein [Acholeplasma sp.]
MTTVLTNEHIYRCFVLGAKYVITEKDALNAINVFPVADGDTGSNLSSLMKSILLKARLEPTMKQTLKSITDAAIIGARGNSGIIFASYIDGFSRDLSKENLDIETFINSMEKASLNAYSSVETPVEGTMITLMRLWHERLKNIHTKSMDFIGLLSKAFEGLKAELENTKELLPILKQSKVVDAGAKGFYHFIEGFIRGLKGEDIDIVFKPTDDMVMHVDHFEESQTRYCTEVLIEGNQIPKEQIKKTLHPLGDSMVVAGSDTLVRIHIHTDTPAKVFELVEPFGQIVDQKVDDMKRQFDIANHKKHKIALVTDSIADLADGFAEANQIHVLNLALLINQATYFDKLTIENKRFYELMNTLKEYPKSSQPNPKTIENLYSFLTTYYDEIIVITVSGKMSGTYQALLNGKKAFKNHKITVIDSLQNSVAEGLLVHKAMSYIEAGFDYDTIVEKVEALRPLTKILVSVKTLKYMIRSGRLKRTTGLVGKMINLKPIISIDREGMGIIEDKAFSLKKADTLIFDHIKAVQKESGIDTFALVHVNAPQRASYYKQTIEAITGVKVCYISEISTIVAMNAGIGSVAVAYIKKEPQNSI